MEFYRHIQFLLMTAAVVLAVVKFKGITSKGDDQKNCNSIFSLQGRCCVVRKLFSLIKKNVYKTEKEQGPDKPSATITICLLTLLLFSQNLIAKTHGDNAFLDKENYLSVRVSFISDVGGLNDGSCDDWVDGFTDGRIANMSKGKTQVGTSAYRLIDNIRRQEMYYLSSVRYNNLLFIDDNSIKKHTNTKRYSLAYFAGEYILITHRRFKANEDSYSKENFIASIQISKVKDFTFYGLSGVISEEDIIIHRLLKVV